MAERLTLEPHEGQKRSWAISENALENDWLRPNKRGNCAENVVFPAHENFDQPYLGLESLSTGSVGRLKPPIGFEYGLLMPGSSTVDRDLNNTGNISRFADAGPTELKWDEHIDASFETFDEGSNPGPEEVCFGAVSASVFHYRVQLI